MYKIFGIACIIQAVLFSFSPVLARELPRRVVSLNLCTDQLALEFAEPGQLKAVSFNARNPALSELYQKADHVFSVRSDIEALLTLKPDLVLMGTEQNPLLQHWLHTQDIGVMTVPVANSLSEVQRQSRRIAWALTGSEAVVRPVPIGTYTMREQAPRVAVYYPRGFTDGRASVMGELLERMGAQMTSQEEGVHYLPLEQLIYQNPEAIVTQSSIHAVKSQGEQLMEHPALARLQAKRVEMPTAWILCPHLHLQNMALMLEEVLDVR